MRFFVLFLLTLYGCKEPPIEQSPQKSPQYKVGNCIQTDSALDIEEWEDDISVSYRIIQVGKRSYLLEMYNRYNKEYTGAFTLKFDDLELVTHTLVCPLEN